MTPKTRTHSLFSPSRLSMLQKCSSWTGRPALTSEAGAAAEDAERGVNLHEAITSAFMQGLQNHDEPVIDYALKTLQEICEGFPYTQWTSEQALDTGIPHVTGYADIIGLDTFDDKAILIELKTGYGNRPAAEGNLQLKAYAAALLREVETVKGYLIEADLRLVSLASWTRTDLPGIHNEIIETIRESLQGGKYQAGAYCEYCSKALICPALEAAIISIQTAEAAINEAKTLTPAEVSEKLSAYWERMEIAERYWNNLKARAISIIEAGRDIPGFTVKVSSGIRKWQEEPAALDSLSKAGVELSTVTALQSPAAVEKTLRATGKAAAEVKGLLAGLTISGLKRQLVKV